MNGDGNTVLKGSYEVSRLHAPSLKRMLKGYAHANGCSLEIDEMKGLLYVMIMFTCKGHSNGVTAFGRQVNAWVDAHYETQHS